jgi:hypothetical protein
MLTDEVLISAMSDVSGGMSRGRRRPGPGARCYVRGLDVVRLAILVLAGLVMSVAGAGGDVLLQLCSGVTEGRLGLIIWSECEDPVLLAG